MKTSLPLLCILLFHTVVPASASLDPHLLLAFQDPPQAEPAPPTDPPADPPAEPEIPPAAEEEPEPAGDAEAPAEEPAKEAATPDHGDNYVRNIIPMQKPALLDQRRLILFQPNIKLNPWEGQDLSLYLLLLSYKRANEDDLQLLYLDPGLKQLRVDFRITDWTINALLLYLRQQGLVTIQEFFPSDDDGDPLVSVTLRKPTSSTWQRDELIPYVNPDVNLGYVIPDGMSLTQLLRAIALQHQITMFVDSDLSVYWGLRNEPYTLNQLLNQLVGNDAIRIQRDGTYLYVRRPRAPGNAGAIRYLPKQKTIAFNLQDMPLQDFSEMLREVSGKTILPGPDLSKHPDLPPLNGTLSMLPLEQGLVALFRQNGLDLLVEDGLLRLVLPNPHVFFNGQNYTVVVRDKPLGEVLEKLAQIHPTQVVLLEKPQQVTSMSLRTDSLEHLLDLLLADAGLNYKRRDQTYMVGNATMPMLEHEDMVRFENVHVAMAFEKMFPEELKKRDGLKITQLDALNGLLFRGQKGLVQEAAATARQIDQPVAQVLLEIIVVEFTRDDNFELGIQLTTPDGGTIFPNISQVFQGFQDPHGNYRIAQLPSSFNLILNALENNDLAKTVMKPRVATLSGLPANLTIGQTLNYKVTSESLVTPNNAAPIIKTSEEIVTVTADISLEMTPWVIGNDQLIVDIKPKFDTFNGAVVDNVPPGQTKKSIEGTVRLRDGQTIILGGLITDSHSVNRQGLPYLQRIPLLGALFRNKKTATQLNDMVIYVTPHIYYGGETSKEYLEDTSVLDYKIPTEWDKLKKKRKNKRKKSKS